MNKKEKSFDTKILGEVIKNISDNFDKELFSKTEEQLEEYWFFKWEANNTTEQNLYKFHDMLCLYQDFCRRWEERHNGSCCVVERVRDKYLMPKIKEFCRQVDRRKDLRDEKRRVS